MACSEIPQSAARLLKQQLAKFFPLTPFEGSDLALDEGA
jgi:hypothetical protein